MSLNKNPLNKRGFFDVLLWLKKEPDGLWWTLEELNL